MLIKDIIHFLLTYTCSLKKDYHERPNYVMLLVSKSETLLENEIWCKVALKLQSPHCHIHTDSNEGLLRRLNVLKYTIGKKLV